MVTDTFNKYLLGAYSLSRWLRRYSDSQRRRDVRFQLRVHRGRQTGAD